MPGFILYWRDKVTEKPSPLTYNNKKTLLFLYLAASADFAGDNKGTYETSINHLSTVVGESYFTTRNWILQLERDALITFQRCFKDRARVTICNYDEFSGVSKVALKMFQRSFKDQNDSAPVDAISEPLNNRTIEQISTCSSSVPLIKLSTNEEGVRKRTTASRKFTRKQLDSIMDTEIIPFGKSIGLDEDDIWMELGAWDDWVQSKGKRITDNKRAFRNWLRNAVKFQKQYNEPVVTYDNIRRLS